jgi:hypothetical protein
VTKKHVHVVRDSACQRTCRITALLPLVDWTADGLPVGAASTLGYERGGVTQQGGSGGQPGTNPRAGAAPGTDRKGT